MSKSHTDTIDSMIADFADGPTDSKAIEYLIRLTKYERASDSGRTSVRLPDGSDVVAVFDRNTGTAGVVRRTLLKERPLAGGRTFREYRVDGMKVFGTDADARAQALELVSNLGEVVDAEAVSNIPGWS